MTSGFESIGPLAQEMTASSEVRGPQTGNLPDSSFRFHFAMDTYAVQLGVPVMQGLLRDFHPTCHLLLSFRSTAPWHQSHDGRAMSDAPIKKPQVKSLAVG